MLLKLLSLPLLYCSSLKSYSVNLNNHDQKFRQTLRATYGITGQLFRSY